MINDAKAKFLAEDLSSAFRRHPHLGNVLTHISSGRWPRVDEALQPLFTPSSKGFEVGPLTRNILELICDNRGTTGRIMQPFFQTYLSRRLNTVDAENIAAWVWHLRRSQPDYVSEDESEIPEARVSSFERLAS